DVRPSLQAQGWQDDRTASLTFVDGDRHEVIDRIGDRPLAVELAHRLRQLVASAGGPVPRPPPPPG
ncbi:MAG TPA: hypothetical protein VE575_15575, partial [Acidimicrobiales bacterium]|nr:hypothetical protein [Acidimicrobiales bacterium]